MTTLSQANHSYVLAEGHKQRANSIFRACGVANISYLFLMLVLSADKNKLTLFSTSRKRPQMIPPVASLEGDQTEVVHEHKHLGVVIDDGLAFNQHRDKLAIKLRITLGFYFQNKSFFIMPKSNLLLPPSDQCSTGFFEVHSQL